jgi:hypothetical protein
VTEEDRMPHLAVLLPLLMVAIPPNAHAKNKHSADTYDKHGCCLSCGYLWCEEKGRCIEEWASCDPGAGDVSTCKFSWAGLSWDLSPLRKAAPYYEITDAFSHPGENYSYAIGICQDVASSKNDDNTWVGSGGGCATTTGDAYESSEAASPAYQARQWCRQWFCGSRTDMSNPSPCALDTPFGPLLVSKTLANRSPQTKRTAAKSRRAASADEHG